MISVDLLHTLTHRSSQHNAWSDVAAGLKRGPAPKPGEVQALKEAAANLAKQRQKKAKGDTGGMKGGGMGRGRGNGGTKRDGVRAKRRDDSPPPIDALAEELPSPRPLPSRAAPKSQTTLKSASAPESFDLTPSSPLKVQSPLLGTMPAVPLAETPSCPLLDGVHFYSLDSKQEDVLWQASAFECTPAAGQGPPPPVLDPGVCDG